MSSGNMSGLIGYCDRYLDNASTLDCTKLLTSMRHVVKSGSLPGFVVGFTANSPDSPRPAKLVGSPGDKTKHVVLCRATTWALRGFPYASPASPINTPRPCVVIDCD